MRGGRRKHSVAQTRIAGEPTGAREKVERAWYRRMTRESALARLVTASQARTEPFHRWLVFKQAFSPGLVRRFLDTAVHLGGATGDVPLLDPFSGTGTFVLECARNGVRAIGFEPLLASAFVTRVASAAHFPDLPNLDDCSSWQELAARLTEPLHQAALVCVVASQQTARGKLNKNSPPIIDALLHQAKIMEDDLRRPLSRQNSVLPGDGRTLDTLADASIGGILTSPPYLSRHDYTKLAQPYEDVYAFWYGSATGTKPHARQLPAHGKAHASNLRSLSDPAVAEIVKTLSLIGEKRWARTVGAYFQGVFDSLHAFHRVLQPGCPCWIAIAGSRIKDVYIPTDTIVADVATTVGFSVKEILVARDVTPSRRRFGSLTGVAPRESLLIMRRT